MTSIFLWVTGENFFPVCHPLAVLHSSPPARSAWLYTVQYHHDAFFKKKLLYGALSTIQAQSKMQSQSHTAILPLQMLSIYACYLNNLVLHKYMIIYHLQCVPSHQDLSLRYYRCRCYLYMPFKNYWFCQSQSNTFSIASGPVFWCDAGFTCVGVWRNPLYWMLPLWV